VALAVLVRERQIRPNHDGAWGLARSAWHDKAPRELPSPRRGK